MSIREYYGWFMDFVDDVVLRHRSHWLCWHVTRALNPDWEVR